MIRTGLDVPRTVRAAFWSGWQEIHSAPGTYLLEFALVLMLGGTATILAGPVTRTVAQVRAPALYAIGILSALLMLGFSRSVANGYDGRKARIRDAFWAFGRPQLWMLALLLSAPNAALLAFIPARPGTVSPGTAWVPPMTPTHWLLVGTALFLLASVAAYAYAAAARYDLDVSAALMTGLRIFTTGHRRWLWTLPFVMLVTMGALVGVGLVLGAVLFAVAHWAPLPPLKSYPLLMRLVLGAPVLLVLWLLMPAFYAALVAAVPNLRD